MICALTFSLHARANWDLIYSNKDFSSYLDFSSLRQSGEFLHIWHMLSFTSSQIIAGKSSFSVEVLVEIDCEGDRSRNLSSIWHADAMGKGSINHSSHQPTTWKNHSPQTMSKHLWFVMCAKDYI